MSDNLEEGQTKERRIKNKKLKLMDFWIFLVRIVSKNNSAKRNSAGKDVLSNGQEFEVIRKNYKRESKPWEDDSNNIPKHWSIDSRRSSDSNPSEINMFLPDSGGIFEGDNENPAPNDGVEPDTEKQEVVEGQQNATDQESDSKDSKEDEKIDFETFILSTQETGETKNNKKSRSQLPKKGKEGKKGKKRVGANNPKFKRKR